MKQTSDKVFIDTNILIYAYSVDETNKKLIVNELLNKHEFIILSTQVINEFINTMYKKKKLKIEDIKNAVIELQKNFSIENISISTIRKALDITSKYNYVFFDSLIISSALETNCAILFSEDMHDSHIIDNRLKIINPFNQ